MPRKFLSTHKVICNWAIYQQKRNIFSLPPQHFFTIFSPLPRQPLIPPQNRPFHPIKQPDKSCKCFPSTKKNLRMTPWDFFVTAGRPISDAYRYLRLVLPPENAYCICASRILKIFFGCAGRPLSEAYRLEIFFCCAVMFFRRGGVETERAGQSDCSALRRGRWPTLPLSQYHRRGEA